MVRAVSVIEFEHVDPGLIGRCSWEVEQTQCDVEVLAWVGRFRFVTAQAVASRFGVSWQQANARVRRLAKLGLLGLGREHVSQARAVFLTGRGHELLGWPRRRAPRAQTHREHEAAIVWLATMLERDADATTRVLTERESRTLEARGDRRYSVDVAGEGRDRRRRRWPDLVVESAAGRRAIEIEFAPKGSARLRRIVDGYESDRFDEVTFYVKSAALGRRIQNLTGRPSALRELLALKVPPVEVAAWPGLPEDAREALDGQLAR